MKPIVRFNLQSHYQHVILGGLTIGIFEVLQGAGMLIFNPPVRCFAEYLYILGDVVWMIVQAR